MKDLEVSFPSVDGEANLKVEISGEKHIDSSDYTIIDLVPNVDFTAWFLETLSVNSDDGTINCDSSDGLDTDAVGDVYGFLLDKIGAAWDVLEDGFNLITGISLPEIPEFPEPGLDESFLCPIFNRLTNHIPLPSAGLDLILSWQTAHPNFRFAGKLAFDPLSEKEGPLGVFYPLPLSKEEGPLSVDEGVIDADQAVVRDAVVYKGKDKGGKDNADRNTTSASGSRDAGSIGTVIRDNNTTSASGFEITPKGIGTSPGVGTSPKNARFKAGIRLSPSYQRK